MSEENIVRRKLSDKHLGKTDWARLKAMTEEEIEAAALSDPDNLPMDVDSPEFWKGLVAVDGRRNLTRLNLDPDILDWFRGQGQGYTRQINAVLRSYMESNADLEPASTDKWKKEAQ